VGWKETQEYVKEIKEMPVETDPLFIRKIARFLEIIFFRI
jgi:hypothetical protein